MSEDLGNSTEALSHDDDDSSSKWTPFEDSEDYPSDSNSNDSNDEDENTDRLTQRGNRHSTNQPQAASDPETRNLLDDAEDNIDGDDDDITQKLNDDTITRIHEVPIDEDVFKISPFQRDYYAQCFMHLQKITQGTCFLNGALNGADERIVEFFRKSGLNTAQLSKIWHLSDVNEDGWLNLAEFSAAMHLIVLRVKGGVPIPSKLPDHFRPPLTPVRNAASSHGSTACSTISSSSSRESDYYQAAAGHQNHHSHAQNHQKPTVIPVNGIQTILDPPHPVSDFSDTPPVLVDSRPTAVKSLVPVTLADAKLPLSPQARGPPPKPPPRDYRNSRGHGRSASLDLNSVFQQKPASSIHISSTSICGCQGEFHTCLPVPQVSSKTSCPTIYAANTNMHSSTSPQPPAMIQNVFQSSTTVAVAQRLVIPTTDTGTQTDGILAMADLSENLDLLLDKTSKSDSSVPENWQSRCEVLRKLNSELESKRVMLSQIRLQLQLRISEIEEAHGKGSSSKSKTSSSSRTHHGVTKPTSL